MLTFDRSSLETKAARVDGKLASDDPVWHEEDPRPVDGVVVSGRLSSAGEERFYFSGSMSGDVGAECRRCLAPARAHVEEELHLLFADATDEDSDESDVYMLEPRATTVDLRPALREQWLLAVPGFALCREDCKGLCPRCGADLNQGPCNCEIQIDPRWAALKGRGA
ncbi:MAG TPA: DUF177 domain-containing protein [Gemmatimonadaceae bacterium]|jgi:uncharacterized protein|nr:DUF177 domain-containing protein [Gemmatimonadaceae bacterium]